MEAGKKTLDHIKKYRPRVSLWNSVRIKFVVIIVTILLVAISSVATALAIAIIRPYKNLLSNSLLLQTKILLDNLELRVQNHFLNPNQEDFDLLLLNRVTFPEAKYVVVTGKSTVPGQEGLHYVLATDCHDITQLIKPQRYTPGVSQFDPEGIDEILQKLAYINDEATAIVQQHTDSVKLLTNEMKELKMRRDPYVLKRQTEIHILKQSCKHGFRRYPIKDSVRIPTIRWKIFRMREPNIYFMNPLSITIVQTLRQTCRVSYSLIFR